MRLKLYSGGEVADEFADDLQLLLTLGEGQLKILLDQMLSVAKGELETDDMEKGIAPSGSSSHCSNDSHKSRKVNLEGGPSFSRFETLIPIGVRFGGTFNLGR